MVEHLIVLANDGQLAILRPRSFNFRTRSQSQPLPLSSALSIVSNFESEADIYLLFYDYRHLPYKMTGIPRTGYRVQCGEGSGMRRIS